MSIIDSYLGDHGVLGLVFGCIRGFIKRDGLSIIGWVVTVFVSVNVAVIAGQVGDAMNLKSGMVYAMVAIAALTSKDIAGGLVVLAEQVARDPQGFWRTWKNEK
jgi:hypothetical protein